MSNTISIPDGYFLHAVQREYSDYKNALWRELIQNAMDAAATRIDVTIDEFGYTFEDNGTGMDRETLKKGMYALGGSVKGEGAVGGFGSAKNLVTLCHNEHRIKTQNVRSFGSGISYSIEDHPDYYHGTSITVEVNGGYGWEKDDQVRRLKTVIANSDLPIQFVINGVPYVASTPKGRKVGRGCRDWCTLYSTPTEYDCWTIAVRVNGLHMFNEYIPGEGIKRKLVMELNGNTRDLLTSNRDGLRHEFRNGISEIISDICQNSNAFKAKTPRRFRFKGQNGPIWIKIKQILKETVALPEEIVEMLEPVEFPDDGVTPETHTEIVLENMIRQMNELGHVAAVERITSMVGEFRESVETVFQGVPIEHDFLIDLADSNYREIPVKYKPGQMGKRAEKIAKFWKYALQTVMEIDGLEGNYRIGFRFDEDNVAARAAEDTPIYWINPDSDRFAYSKSSELAISILQIACHEVAHHYVNTHNEAFICKSEDLFFQVICRIGNFNAWAKAAMQVAI